MEWKPTISVSTACFDGYPLDTALATLAQFDGIDIEIAYIAGYVDSFSEELFSPENAGTVRSQLETVGLHCTNVSAHTDLATDGGLERGLRRIRFTAELGASQVITNAADIRYRDTFLRNLEAFIREAQTAGVRLLLENPGDGIRNVVDDGAGAAAMYAEFGGDALGINYDFGNVISHFGESVRPEEDWRPVRETAAYFHLKDVVHDGEAWRYPALGSGMIDYRTVLADIVADRRVGGLGVELPLRLRRSPENPAGRTPRPLEIDAITATVQESLDFLYGIIA